ncbi:RIP metalloprotease [Candidatus Liberibacter sp.]|uniref:M50 family metallopeptidase n=1 Tax=Candidatus Liberibacter sp. TaxID=34022 RepID=UPI0015F4F575|nr:M50 family metallopeptidase [Candidatus Liberibacter sp.]MBA5724456.1 site-2 protease family protein [Candidatus Liberibacter sp.]
MVFNFLGYVFSLAEISFVIIFMHELGHYIVGRLCGVKVLSFSIGFGPEIIGFTSSSGVRWKFCLIPLLGYVRFSEDKEDKCSLFRVALWKKFLVIAAGPVANFVVATLIFTFIFCKYGIPPMQSDVVVTKVLSETPAAIAGIKPGDHILSLDGNEISSVSEFFENMKKHSAQEEAVFVLKRDRKDVLEIKATPILRDVVDDFGIKRSKKPFIGIVISQDMGEKTGTILEAFSRSLKEVGMKSRDILGSFFYLFSKFDSVLGPIGVVKITKNMYDSGFDSSLYFMAYFSLVVGLTNLMPIPVLDGGHLMFVLLEMLRKKPLGTLSEKIVTGIGLSIILILFIIGVCNDVFRL